MAVLNLPINSVSFGQVSTGLLREAFSRKDDHAVIPIGKVDLSSQRESSSKDSTDNFDNYLREQIDRAASAHGSTERPFKRSDVTVRLWHMQMDSFFFPTDKRHLISFYELDSPTAHEINIVKNCDKVFFSSEYTCEVFRSVGCDNVEYLPLFFDSHNFNSLDEQFFDDDRIVFSLVGKLEKRKHHIKAIKAWVDKYGNNKKFYLNCSIYNHFLSQEENNAAIGQALNGEKPFNVNFIPFMQENKVYNDYLNSSNIVIGVSGGEGWGLPEFQSVAMGSHAVILDCNGYKSWANESNSVLLAPNGKIPAYDGKFFVEGNLFNQGNIFDFSEDDFISACEEAIKRVESDRVNSEGLKLQEEFKASTTYNKIL